MLTTLLVTSSQFCPLKVRIKPNAKQFHQSICPISPMMFSGIDSPLQLLSHNSADLFRLFSLPLLPYVPLTWNLLSELPWFQLHYSDTTLLHTVWKDASHEFYFVQLSLKCQNLHKLPWWIKYTIWNSSKRWLFTLTSKQALLCTAVIQPLKPLQSSVHWLYWRLLAD